MIRIIDRLSAAFAALSLLFLMRQIFGGFLQRGCLASFPALSAIRTNGFIKRKFSKEIFTIFL